jgi:DNA-binding NtrC family response regulator
MMHFLIVDDEPLVCSSLQLLLSRFSVRISIAHQGQEALDIIAKDHVDVMILDLLMPEMSGVEVMKRLFQQQAKLKIIIHTGITESDEAAQAMSLGATIMMPKLASLQKKIDMITEILA